MNNKGFISITVIYTLFILFLMLLLSILASYANNRVLLRISKSDTNDILIDSEDNRQLGIVCQSQKMGKCFGEYANLDHNLYKHDADKIDSKSEYEANDLAFRYSGKNPNNYVCFGSDLNPCPEANLYRIIGIFDNRVKLIKNTTLSTKFVWDSNNKKEWWNSSLKNYLNNDFLNTFAANWQQKIASVTWNVDGVSYNTALNTNAQENFNYELGKNFDSDGMAIEAKIGLMYLTDFYYGASPEYWRLPGLGSGASANNYRNALQDNWLAHNDEYLISVNKDSNQVYRTFAAGYVGGEANIATSQQFIRPVFYLYSQVMVTDGIGTLTEPYRIN